LTKRKPGAQGSRVSEKLKKPEAYFGINTEVV